MELEEKKKELYRQYISDLKTIDDVISLLKKQLIQSGTSFEEKRKLGRRPSETLLQLKTDILNLILVKKEGLNRKSITASLSNLEYKLSKTDFEKLVSKATRRLSDDGKLVCIGDTSGAFWYLSEWIEHGKVKNEFEPKKY